MQPIEFIPLYQERPWGGRTLESKLGRKLPQDKHIGESWEIVDRPDQQSIVADGPLAGQTIRELILRFSHEVLGPDVDPQKPFPILVKWLDCRERLSLQVHPSSEIADKLSSEPKTEHLYIADASEHASIFAGLKPGVTKEQFEQALKDGRIENHLTRLPTHSGDAILVKSGCLHAIDAGNLILEIQQNSDTTYRVHDWGRTSVDGKPRQLHIDEAMQSIRFGKPQSPLLKAESKQTILAECDEFRIRKFHRTAHDEPLHLAAMEQARLLHIVSGELHDNISGKILRSGKNYLQPFAAEVLLKSEAETELLITDQFSDANRSK